MFLLCLHKRVAFYSLLVLFFLPRLAHADRVDRLIKILDTDPSYKVRMQVAIHLGKLRAKKAVPALLKALRDPNEIVQGIAAAALGQIGDRRAVNGLKALIARTSNGFVKKQARSALGRLGEGGGSGGSGGGSSLTSSTRFYVKIGKMSNKSNKGDSRLPNILSNALNKEFSKVSSVATSWPGGNPSARALSKKRIKGYVLDGSITQISHKRSGSMIEISVFIRVSLSSYPAQSMKAFYSGGASTSTSASSFNPANATSIYRDIIEGAATGAKEHILRSYLAHQ